MQILTTLNKSGITSAMALQEFACMNYDSAFVRRLKAVHDDYVKKDKWREEDLRACWTDNQTQTP